MDSTGIAGVSIPALGAAIERAEAAGLRACVESARTVAAEVEPAILEIAGGVAAFAGPSSPLSEASGLGTNGREVGAGDIERLSHFYRERSSPPRIVVSPLATISLPALLAQVGYLPSEYESVLACDVTGVEGERDERITENAGAREWALASARGFSGEDEPGDAVVRIAAIIASAKGVTRLEVRRNRAIVATGAMDVTGDLAGLFGGSTVAAARGQGLQSALIHDRIARARERGARYVRAVAAAAGASERNFRRAGFQILYTRTVWILPIH